MWLLSLHEQSAGTRLGLSFQSAMPKVATFSLASWQPPMKRSAASETRACLQTPLFSPRLNSYITTTSLAHRSYIKTVPPEAHNGVDAD